MPYMRENVTKDSLTLEQFSPGGVANTCMGSALMWHAVGKARAQGTRSGVLGRCLCLQDLTSHGRVGDKGFPNRSTSMCKGPGGLRPQLWSSSWAPRLGSYDRVHLVNATQVQSTPVMKLTAWKWGQTSVP